MRQGSTRCNDKNPESGNLCRLELGHAGAHRWWIAPKAPVEEQCGHKSRRTGLACTVRAGHKGKHHFERPDARPRKEEWFN